MDAVVCQGCRERDARIAGLEARVRELEEQVRELLARLNQNAGNSSIPPSTNPPGAAKPVVKKATGRKPGGQPGHPGHRRRRLPPERVTQTVPFVPPQCEGCGAPLPAQAGANDPEPTWHQVVEIAPTPVEVTEYQGHGRRCAGCGHVTWARIPREFLRHTVGTRLAAFMSYLSGSFHVSKRGLREIVAGLFDVPVSLGTVCHVEAEMSAALAPVHAEAQQAVQAAATKNVDETGWKQAGKLCWLWTAATTTVACFLIHARRGAVGLTALLGETIHGLVTSDRWSAYAKLLSVERRQVCWAHLKRDFQKLIDRGGAALPLGTSLQAVAEKLFHAWHTFRGGGLDRAGLQQEIAPLRVELRQTLESGCGCADGKAATLCRNLLALEPALWTFAAYEGVAPTNNHAERVLRRGVLWRKNAFGCHSAAGCRFVERILTVVQTRRLQQRNVLEFLVQSLSAHRAGLPSPRLIG